MAEFTTPPPTPRNRGDHEAFHVSTVTPLEDIRTVVINRVTWGAVFSGVAMAISVQLILNLLGVGVGIPAFSSSVAVSTLSVSAISWGIISGIIAAACGGFTAGRLAGEVRETTAAWHGLTSWAASVVVVTVLLIAGASSVVGGTLNVAGVGGPSYYARNGMVTGTANGAMMTNSSGIASSTAANNGTVNGTVNTGAAMTAPATPDTTVTPDTTAAAPTTTATAPVTNGPVVTNGTVTIDAATISRGALIAVLGLVLSALAAWFGGWFGTVQPTVTVDAWQGRQLH